MRVSRLTIAAVLLAVVAATDLVAQRPDSVAPTVITLARGASHLLPTSDEISRVAVGDSAIAGVVVLSPREILINGSTIGTTTVILWTGGDAVRVYNIEVTADAAAIQRQFATLFPGEALQVTTQGNLVILSGTVSGGEVARRMVEIARASGGTVIENFQCLRPSASC